MPNSLLQDKIFIPTNEVLNKLKSSLSQFSNEKESKGYKRASDIIEKKEISYSQMKRIKNYFDNYKGNKTDPEYKLNGGDIMNKWVNNELSKNRDSIKTNKEIKMNSGIENAFIKSHEKDKMNKNIDNINQIKLSKGKAKQIYQDKPFYESDIKNYIKNLLNEEFISEVNSKPKDYLNWKRKNVTIRGVKQIGEENNAGAMLGRGLYTAFLSNKSLAK